MPKFVYQLIGVFAAFTFLGFTGGVALADTDVIFSNILLSNDPHASFTDGVFQGSVWTNENLSIYVGESDVLNEWDDFEIWYQVSIGADEWAVFPIDGAQLGANQTYTYTDLHWDANGHRDTLQCVLTSADYASSTSANICEFIVYCIDYYGM